MTVAYCFAMALASTNTPVFPLGSRGYDSRACGFDLDGDGVLGEPGDDCNICDGSTVDPDGDGVAEDLIYVDCGAGSNGNGTPGSPYNRLSSAMAAMDGPGDGAEDIVCFKGTCRNESLNWTTSGVPGSYRSSLTSTVDHSFTLPQDPAMLIGWDADNDGRYPPYDTDDTAILDGNANGNTARAITINGHNYLEVAHFTARDYNLDGGDGGFVYRTGGGGDYNYFHDLSLENINKGYGDSSGRGTFISFGGADDYITLYNLNIQDFGGYMFRGAVNSSPEVFDFAFINITAVGHGGTGDSGANVSGIKLWGAVTNVFVLDSILDGDPDGWGQGYSVDTVYAVAPAQCTRNWTIRNNEFKDWEYAIVVQPDAGSGFCRSRTLKNTLIDSNVITNAYAPYQWGDYGISAVQGYGPATATIENLTISNNYLSSSTGWEACLWIDAGNPSGTNPGSIDIVNNTCYGDINRHAAIVVGDAEGSGANYPEQQITLKNNIIDGLGSGDLAVWTGYAPSSWIADYNTYDNLTGNKFVWNRGNQTGFSTWKNTSGGDAHSSECSPTFAQEGLFDIHLANTDTCARDRGTSVAAITTTDIDGDSRPQGAAWDIGADEFLAGEGFSAPLVQLDRTFSDTVSEEGAVAFDLPAASGMRLLATLGWSEGDSALELLIACGDEVVGRANGGAPLVRRLEISLESEVPCRVSVRSQAGTHEFWLRLSLLPSDMS